MLAQGKPAVGWLNWCLQILAKTNRTGSGQGAEQHALPTDYLARWRVWLHASFLAVHLIIPIGLKCLTAVSTHFSYMKLCSCHPGTSTEAPQSLIQKVFQSIPNISTAKSFILHTMPAAIPLKKCQNFAFLAQDLANRIALSIRWFLGAVNLLWLCPGVEFQPVGLCTAPWVTNSPDCIFIEKTYINVWNCWRAEHSSHPHLFFCGKKKSQTLAIFWSSNNGKIS